MLGTPTVGPCEACPVEAGKCHGLIHRPYCEDIRRGLPGRAEQLIAVAGGPPNPEPPPVPLAVSLAILKCEHKGPPCDPCGSFASCALGNGANPGKPSYEDCVRCVGEAT